MTAPLRRITAAVLSPALFGLFTGCFGSVRGGNDSETHFACTTDRYCMELGNGLRCIQGHCGKPADPAGSKMAATSPGADAGPVTAPPAPGSDGGILPTPLEVARKGGLQTGASDASGPWGKPLASPITISGTILFAKDTALPAQYQQNLGVALVWDMMTDSPMDPDCSGDPARDHIAVVQPAETSILGSEFTIRVSETPPYDAFSHPTPPGGVNWTQGAIIFYQDNDRDGRLDFGTPSQPSADFVIGTSSPLDMDPSIGYPRSRETYRITYSDADITADLPMIAAGYGMSYWKDYDYTLGQAVPIDRRVSVLADFGLAAQKLLCKKVCFSTTRETCPASPRVQDLPAGEGMCVPATAQSAAMFRYIATTCDGCRCTSLACDYTEEGHDPDWPCLSDGGVLTR